MSQETLARKMIKLIGCEDTKLLKVEGVEHSKWIETVDWESQKTTEHKLQTDVCAAMPQIEKVLNFPEFTPALTWNVECVQSGVAGYEKYVITIHTGNKVVAKHYESRIRKEVWNIIPLIVPNVSVEIKVVE
ncbi:MAG: hypothetical protein FWF12_09780 [Betaproteobacteria bacterium]|nr:hypothetical protein [Betaproteobacteria bacterium]